MKRFQDVTAGFTIALCLDSLFQDALGLEGYVAYCRDYWVDSSYTIPIAAASLVILVWSLAKR